MKAIKRYTASVFIFMVCAASLLVPSLVFSEDANIESIQALIKARLPHIQIDHLQQTPVPGIFELITDGDVFYIDSTVSYLFDGNLVNLKQKKNLTEQSLHAQQWQQINAIGEENMLIYTSDTIPTSRSLSVFTDVDCPYCQKLHSELSVLLDAGVKVRYLLYPRAGLNSDAHEKLESVWCADHPKEALNSAKKGHYAEPRTCDNPIISHVALAQRLSITATPMIYLDTGERINGYLDAETLLEILNEGEPIID